MSESTRQWASYYKNEDDDPTIILFESWEDALEEAVETVVDTYYQHEDEVDEADLPVLPTITKSVDLIGPGSDKLTLDGKGLSRIIYANAANITVNIEGLTLTNGSVASGMKAGTFRSIIPMTPMVTTAATASIIILSLSSTIMAIPAGISGYSQRTTPRSTAPTPDRGRTSSRVWTGFRQWPA